MSTVCVSLFGRMAIKRDDGTSLEIDSLKAQELLCILLLRRRPQPRELLAGLLWADHPMSTARGYLRKALWQLQNGLHALDNEGDIASLYVRQDEIGLEPGAAMTVDAIRFEQAIAAARNCPGRELSEATADDLRSAVELYRGDLLEGWYQDWCLVERERFEVLYFAAVDKLMSYCETHHEFEEGISYGLASLARDRAREHTHRALMRLYYVAGDRTGALRQFQRCTTALREELSVSPSPQTIALYERIQGNSETSSTRPMEESRPEDADGEGLLAGLQRLRGALQTFESQVTRQIDALKLRDRR